MNGQNQTAGVQSAAALSLGPRSVERPADAGATQVAGIDGIAPAWVDGGGLVSPQGSWSVDWWVGADDRWHLPAREPSVRQRRIGHGPVIETSLRVPSGDILQTAYPVMIGGRSLTVVEISNQSPVPVALAMAIRPYTAAGPAVDSAGPFESVSARLELVGSSEVTVDGRTLLWLPRAPNEAGAADERDLFDDVMAGRALSWSNQVAGPMANAVCLYPLPHKTELRFVIGPVAAEEDYRPVPTIAVDQLPDPEAAARGWNAVVDRSARFEFPEPGISALSGAARARLVMAATGLAAEIVALAPGAGTLLAGLAYGGHLQECRWSLEALAESFPTQLPGPAIDGAEIVDGAALAAELIGDDGLNQRLLEVLAQLTHLVERHSNRVAVDRPAVDRAKVGLARLARVVGQSDVSGELLAEVAADGALDTRYRSLDEIVVMAEAAAPAKRWSGPAFGDEASAGQTSSADETSADSPRLAAEFWLASRGLLLREEESGAPTIELLPEFPAAWRGGEVEVHEAPIAGVRVSFAVRWHGYRPALLWEVSGTDPTATLTLRCPGLDPDWSTTESSGEALLAGSATDLPDAPAPGDSFS